ncbi:hypothetical protein P8605_45860 [Streptomyces sp. T-3]|nr:hypothetical protein [Streptomyces sp. T-3]
MDRSRVRFRRWYGESPLQLALLLGSFAVVAYAGVRLLDGDWFAIAAWLIGAALVHDLVLLPAYALAGRAVRRVVGGSRSGPLNFVRVPAALSGLLLLVWFPLITRQSAGRYERSTGLSAEVFLWRWSALTACLFAGSGLWFAVRTLRGRRSATKGRPSASH